LGWTWWLHTQHHHAGESWSGEHVEEFRVQSGHQGEKELASSHLPH
jgi:hypothetical protein